MVCRILAARFGVSLLLAQPFSPPTISGPSNLLVYPTAPPPLVSFTVGDAEDPAESLVLTGFSSNTNVLDSTNIVFGGSGTNRTATLNFTPGTVGTSVVAVVVTDLSGLTATNTFRLEVSYFTDMTPVLSGGNYFNGRWADYDNDNRLDLYCGGGVYHNDGNGEFTKVADLSAGVRNGLAWGDFDRDGALDLAIAGTSTAQIFRNNRNWSFTDIGAALMQGLSYGALAWGDYDNDGRLDLVQSGYASNGGRYTYLYHNNGDGTFSLVPNAGLPGVDEAAFAWGDYDNDGRLDLLLAGGIGPSTFLSEICHNNGDGTFTAIGAGMIGIREGSVSWGDYDNDGRLDALVVGFCYGSYILNVYRNNGNGTFTDLGLGLQGTAFGEGLWTDFDNDGYSDIFVSGCTVNYCDSRITRIYRNNHNATFSDVNAGLPPIAGPPGSWGDFDNDGDLDLFIYGLFRNNCNVSNSPPTAPLGLVADLLPGNNVRLRWEPPSDAQNTDSAGLSYAVRVGTSPGGTDYVPPHADPATGYRRLPERGPLNTNACYLRDMPRGAYYWSVQAIDAGWAGSPFGLEATFEITNARPLISAISNQVTVPGRTTPPIAFTVSDVETPAGNLTLSASSSDTTLVGLANIVFGGAGSNRTVTLTPAAGRSGTTTIAVRVDDGGGLVATSRFDLVVQTFTDANAGLPTSYTGTSAWGDYDNDRDLDIALASASISSYTTVYRNNGGAFTDQVLNLPAQTDNDLVWVDYDNDGDLDMTQEGWFGGYSPTVYIFRNNGTNSFTTLTMRAVTNVAFGSLAWGDYDHDGDPDLLITGDPNTYHSADGFTALYRNDRGVLTNTAAVLPWVCRGAGLWFDYDNDGDLDILLTGQKSNAVTTAITKLFRNDGNDVFTEVPTAFAPVTQAAVAVGDFDNDGHLDVALAGLGTNSLLLARIYRNNGNGTFTDTGASLTGVSYCSLAWGDYDNDGFLDLALGGTTNGYSYGPITRVYHNNHGVSFTDTDSALPGTYLHSLSWGDYDTDGDLDLLLGSRVYRNNWNIANTPPAAPTNLSVAILPNNELLFSWSPSTDAETTNAHGLSYNLRVGTNSGGAQIVSPQADPITGYRRVPQLGNAGQTNAWRLVGLTNGTYSWSVQAIDTALAGSPFAAEGTLVLARPVFSAITNRSTPPNTTAGPINFTVTDPQDPFAILPVAAVSSDTNVVPNTNLTVSGTGFVRSLWITPATNRVGTITITITATSTGGQVASASFQLTVERFAPIATLSDNYSGSVAWGDYNNDGLLDLAVGCLLARNNGNGTFFPMYSPFPGASANALVVWGDYDQDGDLDALVSGGNTTRIYHNYGSGTFTDIAAGFPAVNSVAAAWGDFDNDGDLDLLLASGSFTRLYRNDGNLGFTLSGIGLPSAPTSSVAWGDFNNDGYLDVLVSGNGPLRVFRNNGNSTFTDLNLGLPQFYFTAAAWGDFDNDGYADFAVTGSTNGTASGIVTRIYRNTRLNTFTNIYPVPSLGPTGVWKGCVAWGDYDNDGDPDLILSGETATGGTLTKLYRNDGGLFTDSGDHLPGLRYSSVAWGDLDNDGKLDLALGPTVAGAGGAQIYRGYADAPTNQPPTAPGNPAVSVLPKHSVRLSWQAATDPNQPAGLTYNVRVGKAPGLGDVLPSMSAASGFRLVPAPGNAGERLSLTLTNLYGGTFYWSIQAVDGSFAGSPFSTEASFNLPNAAPVAYGQSVTTSEDTPLGIFVVATDADGDALGYQVVDYPLFGTLGGLVPNLTYIPATNYFGFDQFTFRVNDRNTNSVPATVFITVTPVLDGDRATLGLQASSGGSAHVQLQGEPWQTYRIEASDDLVHWVPLANVLATNLLTQLIDADAPYYPRRFYRAAETVIAPAFGSSLQSDNGRFQFILAGERGRNYQLQASTNLSSWSVVTNILMTSSTMPFVDAGAGNYPYRFYRLVLVH